MKDSRVYLAQILESIRRLEEFTRDGREAFFSSRLVQDAVIRNFEIVGEAAKRLPEEYKKQHPNIPWRNMTAFRNVLIHDYDNVSLEEVWRIIEEEMPGLKSSIEAILPPLDQLEAELAGEE